MDIETYIAFLAVSVLLCTVPGPDMLYVLGRSVANGRKAGLYAAVGINVGAYVHLLAAVLGLSAILSASAVVFTIVKWLGALYLGWLGIDLLRSGRSPTTVSAVKDPQTENAGIFWQGFLIDALNPKVVLFYVSVLPQFVSQHDGDITTQLVILGVSLNVVGLVTNLVLVQFASAVTRRTRESTRITNWLNKLLGGVLVAMGVRMVREPM